MTTSRRSTSVPPGAIYISAPQVCDRYGGVSHMWLERKLQATFRARNTSAGYGSGRSTSSKPTSAAQPQRDRLLVHDKRSRLRSLEVKTGKGSDALHRRPQLAAALAVASHNLVFRNRRGDGSKLVFPRSPASNAWRSPNSTIRL
jgi:hypothetical protein